MGGIGWGAPLVSHQVKGNTPSKYNRTLINPRDVELTCSTDGWVVLIKVRFSLSTEKLYVIY